VATDPRKTQAIMDWPTPTNVTELRGFLGLTRYYRKFVRHYGTLAKPLTNLLKKKQFEWDQTAQHAFNSLKAAMSTTPVLALPDFTKQFVLETDASDMGLGVVLMQQEKPIAFLSKSLSATNKYLSIYEKGFLALIMAVERWRAYLQRQEFIIKTNHKSLAYLTDQSLQSELQRKAMTKLMGLQFKIQYKKGKDNKAADALSRIPSLMAIQSCSEVKPLWIQEVTNSYATNSYAHDLLIQLAVQSSNDPGFSLHQGITRQGNMIWVGGNSALRTKLIAAFHSTPIGGHSRIHATYMRIKKWFCWRGLKQDVENFVKQCETCHHAKVEKATPIGLLQPLPIPAGAWKDITMDFIKGLPKSEGFNSILIIMDRFSKYAHFLPLKHPFFAKQVAQVLLDMVVRLHGMP
jgi:hypothetical protein